jgi:hypothetical protein
MNHASGIGFLTSTTLSLLNQLPWGPSRTLLLGSNAGNGLKNYSGPRKNLIPSFPMYSPWLLLLHCLFLHMPVSFSRLGRDSIELSCSYTGFGVMALGLESATCSMCLIARHLTMLSVSVFLFQTRMEILFSQGYRGNEWVIACKICSTALGISQVATICFIVIYIK